MVSFITFPAFYGFQLVRLDAPTQLHLHAGAHQILPVLPRLVIHILRDVVREEPLYITYKSIRIQSTSFPLDWSKDAPTNVMSFPDDWYFK